MTRRDLLALLGLAPAFRRLTTMAVVPPPQSIMVSTRASAMTYKGVPIDWFAWDKQTGHFRPLEDMP